MRKGSLYARIINLVILSIGSVMMIFPLLWMINTALQDKSKVFINPPEIIPQPLHFENFVRVFEDNLLFYGFKNSGIVAVLVIIVGTFTSSLAAYAFEKLSFPFKEKLFFLLISTMMIPFAIVLLPQYAVFSRIGWVDTLYPLIVPGMFGNIGMVFFIRQYLRGMPNEILEAAKVDGSPYFLTYIKIILPEIKPALAAQIILWFMGIWNDFLGPVIYLNSPDKMTIQPIIATFKTAYVSTCDYPIIMTASLISILPIIIIFLVFQKYFIESLSISGIK